MLSNSFPLCYFKVTRFDVMLVDKSCENIYLERLKMLSYSDSDLPILWILTVFQHQTQVNIFHNNNKLVSLFRSCNDFEFFTNEGYLMFLIYIDREQEFFPSPNALSFIFL